jgi:glycosyltransferase involved in cell wall biosynthesis
MQNAAPECADRIHCVYHGIHLKEWHVDREPVKDPPLLIAVGRLTPKKGFTDFVRALGILRDRGIEAQAEIIGEGRERHRLSALIQELDLGDRVPLLGRMPQEEIRHRFQAAAALVLPSVVLKSNNQDGLANVVLEAMASGVPVVVSDLPALLEVVTDRETGLVFPSGDSMALADRLAELLGDPVLQESLSRKGRERITTFDCSRAADQLSHLFNSHA